MATYYGTTSPSSQANPPRALTQPLASNPAIKGSTMYLSTQGSTAANDPNAPGGGGGTLWSYVSTNSSTDCQASNFFSDGFYMGMRPGDIVLGVSFTSLGSSLVTWMGAVVSVSTAGASLSTGSVMTSTFN